MAQTTFAYKVRDTEGKLLEGTLDGERPGLVAKRLRQMGYTPINIEAQDSSQQGHEEGPAPSWHGRAGAAQGPGHLQQAVRYSYQRRADAVESAQHPRGADRAPGVGKGRDRCPPPGRKRHLALASHGHSPQGVRQAVHRDGEGGRSQRRTGQVAPVAGRDDGKAGGVAGQDQVRHGISIGSLLPGDPHRRCHPSVHSARCSKASTAPWAARCRHPRDFSNLYRASP